MDGWARAELALHLFAQNPARIGGVVVRLRAGPARDRVRIWLQAHLDTVCISPSISDDQLYGGIDLSAALAHGRLIQTQGLLHPGKTVILTMAERCEPHLAAKLAHALEQRQIAGLIALDEGADEDERCPDVLAQHLALHIAPEGRMSDDWLTRTSGGDKTNEPEKLFNKINAVPAGTVKIDPNHLSDLTELAARFGIDSLRAPLLAAVVAKAHAGLCGRDQTNFTDIETAAALVFPQRATQLPDRQDA
ncbi:MAG: magnesium chelatase ATPase subunit D, partial [Rhodobacteraceae bacterium]|nr:magnesium chelatase ATPase subunit D [Paracoccaceae bacterium]